MKNNKIYYHIAIVVLLWGLYRVLYSGWQGFVFFDAFLVGYGFGSFMFDILNIIDKR